MVGVFVFPAKPKDNSYPYFNSPKKVLEIDDSEVVTLIRQKETSGFIHWQDDWNDLTDNELIENVNQHDGYSYSISSRKSGLGYNSEGKAKYIRIIRQKYSWFKERLL